MKCSVCKNGIPKGTGRMFVRNTGQILHFCSPKCQKNWKMNRSPKKMKWARPKEAKK